jgi:hypothetical protein
VRYTGLSSPLAIWSKLTVAEDDGAGGVFVGGAAGLAGVESAGRAGRFDAAIVAGVAGLEGSTEGRVAAGADRVGADTTTAKVGSGATCGEQAPSKRANPRNIRRRREMSVNRIWKVRRLFSAELNKTKLVIFH